MFYVCQVTIKFEPFLSLPLLIHHVPPDHLPITQKSTVFYDFLFSIGQFTTSTPPHLHPTKKVIYESDGSCREQKKNLKPNRIHIFARNRSQIAVRANHVRWQWESVVCDLPALPRLPRITAMPADRERERDRGTEKEKKNPSLS